VAVQDRATPDIVRLSDELQTNLLLAPRGQWPPRTLGRHGCAALGGLVIVAGGTARLRRAAPAAHDDAASPRRHADRRGRRTGLAASRFAAPTSATSCSAARPGRPVRDRTPGRASRRCGCRSAPRWSRRSAPAHPAAGGHADLHIYDTGASLTFTVLARALDGQEESQWRAAKDPPARRSSAPARRSPTTTASAETREWVAAELGALGVSSLHALKDHLDPPGDEPRKLIPAA